jgi:hypothetical protein
MQAIYLAVVICLLPTVTMAGERSERRWLYERSDHEWFERRGEILRQAGAAAELGSDTGTAALTR